MKSFERLTILEIAEGVAGPACGLRLADLGATVVKVEPPEGDRARGWGPILADGASAIFAQLNRGKRSVVLDLGTPDGVAQLERLAAGADAIVAHRDPDDPGAIDWRALQARHPHCVAVRIDDTGPKGVLGNLAGSELVVQAMSGFNRYVGEPGGEPCRVGFEIAGMSAAMHAFHAVCAGLFHRHRSGRGQYVGITSLTALLSLKTLLMAAQSGGMDAWNGFHLNGPFWPPDTGWDTSDGQVTFDFRHGERDAWADFCRSVGLDWLLDHPDYKDWRSTIYIGDRRHAFGGPYREVFAKMTCEEASKRINDKGGISVKFHDYAEVLAHPQIEALEPFVAVPDAAEGAKRQIGVPFKVEGEALPSSYARAPSLGEHSAAVLAAPPARAPRVAQASSPRPDKGPTGPLRGIRVLDASMGAVGPWAGSLLGELGADVVKMESPQGDFIRAVMPAKRGLSTTYTSSNCNKRGIVLDLKDPAGRKSALALANQADVFLENFRPGVADRIGVGYAALSKDNPRLIYVSASGFGAKGPLGGLGGTDPHLQPFTGSCSVNGMPGGKRQRWRWYGHFDVNTALCIVEGVLAALLEREETGRGRYIQVTMVEAGLALQRVRLAEHMGGGRPRPMGSGTTYLVPDQAFRTVDRPIAVSATNERQWRSLCTVLGRPDLCADPRFATNATRTANRETLIPKLEGSFRERPASYWIERLRAAHVPCTPFMQFEQFRHHAHYLENGMVRPFETRRWGHLTYGGVPYAFDETPCELWPGQVTGECTDEVVGGNWPPLDGPRR
jgi:crotonobetainyl-CoA:carnitine CoA-transferase CaiB-like acyl-CoA transferase